MKIAFFFALLPAEDFESLTDSASRTFFAYLSNALGQFFSCRVWAIDPVFPKNSVCVYVFEDVPSLNIRSIITSSPPRSLKSLVRKTEREYSITSCDIDQR